MMDTERYDAILIGSGQAAGPLATDLVAAGRERTVLIEREHIGGTCINEGCTPTKTMVAGAGVADAVRRAAEYGIDVANFKVDMKRVRERKRAMVRQFNTSSTGAIRGGGVEIVMGEARFESPEVIEVRLNGGGSRRLSADLIVIDTGSRPAIPPIEGLDGVPFLTSTTAMELDAVPEHLLIIGGGYVGVEFGQMFRRFGSAVSVIQRGPHLLDREDKDISEAVESTLREDGVGIYLSTEIEQVAVEGEAVRLDMRHSRGPVTVSGSHLLVAAGRSPNTEALNLPAAGIATTDEGFIKVNERLETPRSGIYAVGEVTGAPAFTHLSYDDYRILRENLLRGGSRTTTGRPIPYTVFIDPQLGRVGMTEKEARGQGKKILVGRTPVSDIARAQESGRERGVMKAVVDADTEQILGCAILSMEGGEVMAMMEIAMMGKLPYTALRDGIFAHPTLAEAFNGLFGSLSEG